MEGRRHAHYLPLAKDESCLVSFTYQAGEKAHHEVWRQLSRIWFHGQRMPSPVLPYV